MKYLITILSLLIATGTWAQVDRTKAPEAGTPTDFKMGKYQTFTLKNGLKVILVENNKIPRVTYQFILDRPPILEGAKAGYVNLTGDLISAGTQTMSKEQLDEEIDFLGANFGTSSSFVYISGLSRNKERMMELFADVVKNPALPADELEKLKTKTLSNLKASRENADAISSNLQNARIFGSDHPYGESISEESISLVTLDDCKNYYNSFFKPNNAYLVVVGNISKKEISKLSKKFFGKWEEGKRIEAQIKIPSPPKQNTVALANKAGAVQSVIAIGYPLINKPGNADAAKLTLLNQVLGGGSFNARLVKNIREDKGYTYGAYSRMNSDEYVGSFTTGASVRTEVTDSAITEFLYEMNRLLSEDISEEELEIAKNNIIGSFARSVENPQTVARFALNIARYNLPTNYYETYLGTIKNITAKELRETAKKYIKPENCHITVVGNVSELSEKLNRFGEVRYFNSQGVEIEKPKNEVPKGLTAEKVFTNYLNAVGGIEKVKQVNSFNIEFEAKIPSGTITLEQTSKNYDKLILNFKMNGTSMSKTIMNQDKGKIIFNGQEMDMDEATLSTFKYQSYLCEELAYLDAATKLKFKIVGSEDFEGKSAIAVEVDYGTSKTVRLYDAKTWFLLGMRAEQQGMTIVNKYANYKAVDGILIPHSNSNSQLPVALELKTAEFNTKIDDGIFKL